MEPLVIILSNGRKKLNEYIEAVKEGKNIAPCGCFAELQRLPELEGIPARFSEAHDKESLKHLASQLKAARDHIVIGLNTIA